jgi:hypothetical protein
LSDRFIFGSWAEHTASWWPYRDHENVLLVTYTELKRDPRTIIPRIADLMKVILTETHVEMVVEKSSFEYMKTHEDKFVPPLWIFREKQLSNAVALQEAPAPPPGSATAPWRSACTSAGAPLRPG